VSGENGNGKNGHDGFRFRINWELGFNSDLRQAYMSAALGRVAMAAQHFGIRIESPREATFFGELLSAIDAQSGLELSTSDDKPGDMYMTGWSIQTLDMEDGSGKRDGVWFTVIDKNTRYVWFIVPQWPWREYRTDFACHLFKFRDGRLQRPTSPVVFEIDGESYHNTPAQRTKDKARDRHMQTEGISVYRYTGDDVLEEQFNVRLCGFKALSILVQHIYRIKREAVRKMVRAKP
jgi:very-short-patch-repair endonuclease